MVYCYESIQGKPGDITRKTSFLGFAEKGSDGLTPSRLHRNCFFELADTYTQRPKHKLICAKGIKNHIQIFILAHLIGLFNYCSVVNKRNLQKVIWFVVHSSKAGFKFKIPNWVQ